MGTINPDLTLFYFLLISGIVLLLVLLYGLLRSPPGCMTEKDNRPGNPASQAF